MATPTSLAKPSLQLSPRITEKAPPSWVESRIAKTACVFFGALVMRQCHALFISMRSILRMHEFRLPTRARSGAFAVHQHVENAGLADLQSAGRKPLRKDRGELRTGAVPFALRSLPELLTVLGDEEKARQRLFVR